MPSCYILCSIVSTSKPFGTIQLHFVFCCASKPFGTIQMPILWVMLITSVFLNTCHRFRQCISNHSSLLGKFDWNSLCVVSHAMSVYELHFLCLRVRLPTPSPPPPKYWIYTLLHCFAGRFFLSWIISILKFEHLNALMHCFNMW